MINVRNYANLVKIIQGELICLKNQNSIFGFWALPL